MSIADGACVRDAAHSELNLHLQLFHLGRSVTFGKGVEEDHLQYVDLEENRVPFNDLPLILTKRGTTAQELVVDSVGATAT